MLTPKQYEDALTQLTAHIQDREPISFAYKGEIRVVEPHALGRNGKLRAWQVASSNPDSVPGWRFFDIIKIETPTFTPRPGYVPNDQFLMDHGGIIAQV